MKFHQLLITAVLISLILGCAHLEHKSSERTLSVSAASGLTKINNSFFIVADDELFLTEVTATGAELRHSLFAGELSEDPKERKKVKPDLESVLVDGDLIVAVPSFSTPKRFRAATFNLQTKETQILDLSVLQKALESYFKHVNIEGAVLRGDEIWLLQRGNGVHRENGLVITDRSLSKIKKVIHIDLGELDGHALGFSDASMHDGKLYFLAVAENTSSTYEDGAFMGSVIGVLSDDGKVTAMKTLDVAHKPEGLWIDLKSVFVVTDADDRSISARLIQIK